MKKRIQCITSTIQRWYTICLIVGRRGCDMGEKDYDIQPQNKKIKIKTARVYSINTSIKVVRHLGRYLDNSIIIFYVQFPSHLNQNKQNHHKNKSDSFKLYRIHIQQ